MQAVRALDCFDDAATVRSPGGRETNRASPRRRGPASNSSSRRRTSRAGGQRRRERRADEQTGRRAWTGASISAEAPKDRHTTSARPDRRFSALETQSRQKGRPIGKSVRASRARRTALDHFRGRAHKLATSCDLRARHRHFSGFSARAISANRHWLCGNLSDSDLDCDSTARRVDPPTRLRPRHKRSIALALASQPSALSYLLQQWPLPSPLADRPRSRRRTRCVASRVRWRVRRSPRAHVSRR